MQPIDERAGAARPGHELAVGEDFRRGRGRRLADDEKLGYNRGLLGLKLGNFRESFTSVTYGVATKTGPNLALSGELTGPGAERCKFTVTVAPAGSGWLVEDFRHD